jgi:germination protein M
MLKKISIRKIFITTLMLFLILVIYMIPRENLYTLDNKIKQELEYVNCINNCQTVFLMDSNSYISKTEILMSNKTNNIEMKAKELLETLIIDGINENKIPNGFRGVIPSSTKINDIKYNNGLLIVDFSKEILDINQEYEEKMISSIIYTLVNIKDINKIQIKVDGVLLTKLPKSNIVLPEYLTKGFGINKSYNLMDTKNITNVTVYYLNEYNDKYYYVPVTKYINDNKDKIKIIIDELTGGPVYESNLMSFLNTNTKLLSYDINSDVATLYFNDYIFSDIKNEKILEEVVYGIAYSIYDSYDVKEVVFMHESKKIIDCVSNVCNKENKN